jgi:hypothetical protein
MDHPAIHASDVALTNTVKAIQARKMWRRPSRPATNASLRCKPK